MIPLLVIAEPTHDSIRRALETAVSGATILVRSAPNVAIVDSAVIREALKPSPIDHWSDALLDGPPPHLAAHYPRKDRRARRDRGGRLERRDYAGRSW